MTLAEGLTGYGQYSNAKDPVSANIFLVDANQNFDLTEARQWEGGIKADVRQGRVQLTAAYFDIERDDVLQPFAVDSATNVGGIASAGVAIAGTVRVNADVRVGANGPAALAFAVVYNDRSAVDSRGLSMPAPAASRQLLAN